jgi:hypothetical protein
VTATPNWNERKPHNVSIFPDFTNSSRPFCGVKQCGQYPQPLAAQAGLHAAGWWYVVDVAIATAMALTQN